MAYFAKKKKFEKWPFWYQNHGLTPLKKCQFFDCFNFLFWYLRKAFIRSRISSKRLISSLFSLKKKGLKNGHFDTKIMGSPLWKNVNFLTVSTFCFHILERPLFVLEYRKRDFFLAFFAPQKKVRKMAILRPKPWVNPFGKMSIFRRFNFLFSYPRKAFIRSRIS